MNIPLVTIYCIYLSLGLSFTHSRWYWFSFKLKLLLLQLSLLLKSLQSCPTDSVWPHRRQPPRLPHPWDSPGKNTGAGCHFLLQCMKVKSESEMAQSYPTLSNPMDCSFPGSSVQWIFQARVLEWSAIAFHFLELIKNECPLWGINYSQRDCERQRDQMTCPWLWDK